MSENYSEEIVSEEEDEFASASEGEDALPHPVQIGDKSQTATGKGAVTLDATLNSREQQKESTFDKNTEQSPTAPLSNTYTMSTGQQGMLTSYGRRGRRSRLTFYFCLTISLPQKPQVGALGVPGYLLPLVMPQRLSSWGM